MAVKKKKAPARPNPSLLSRFLPTFFFIAIAILYLHNLTRDVYSGDIGDLVTASYFLGVAHPPGYPLFMMLGFCFSHLPLALPVVTKVALVSAFASLGALWFFYLFAKDVTKHRYLSLIASAILGLSYLFWLHAEIPEAFGLLNFFASALLFLIYRYHKDKNPRYLYLIGLVTGLSLTHHHTILFLFPGILFILLGHARSIFSSWKQVGVALLAFFIGLLPYLYVPLAAMQNPVINWDSANTLQNFLHLLLRKDYGFAPSVVNEVPPSVKMIHVTSFLKALVTNYSYQVLALAGIGFFWIFKKDRLYLVGLTLCFLFTGPFFVFYAAGLTGVPVGMGIIERFYVLPSLVLMFYVPFGLDALRVFLNTKFSKSYYSLVLLSYFLIIPLLLFQYNFPKTNLSQTMIGNNLADNIFSYLPQNAVLFVSGDTTTFNIWYNHYVLKKRPDIRIINPPGVGGNAYFDDEINAYYKNHPQASFSDIPSKTIEAIRAKRPIFSTYPIDFTPKGTTMLPRGLVYEMTTVHSLPTQEAYLATAEAHLRRLHMVRRDTLRPDESNLVAAEMPGIYASGLVRIGDFVDSYYKNPALSEHYYRRALWIDPDHPNAYAGLALSQYKAYSDCKNAPESMRTAISLYPVWRTYYAQLYLILQGCHASKRSLQNVSQEYNRLFHEDIQDILTQRKR